MWGFMMGYTWGNGHLATREGHCHPIGVDLMNASVCVMQTGVSMS